MSGAETPADPDTRAIRFRIRFTVAEPGAARFVRLLREEYLPALAAQRGFLAASVLTPYSAALSDEIGAVASTEVIELEFDFASETLRRAWVAQPIHDRLWARAVELSTAQEWSGFFADGTGGSAAPGSVEEGRYVDSRTA